MALNLGVPDEPEQPAPVPATMQRGSGLARYEALKVAIARCHRVDEAKEIRDKASALRAYAAQAMDREALRQLAEIVLRAERRAGVLLGEMADGGTRHSGHGDQKTESQAATPKLKDLGINRSQASRWQLAASVSEEAFEAWLKGLGPNTVPTSAALRTLAKVRSAAAKATGGEADAPEGGTGQSLEDLAFDHPNAFGAIYADPPWRFETRSVAGQDRAPEAHYPTLDMKALSAMWPDVQALAAKDCALFLWSVDPMLPEALHLIEDWGFTYKTVAFTWAKTAQGGAWHRGLGYWTRANPEMCLLATRGCPVRIERDVDQLFIAARGAHSAKPPGVRGRIERLVGGPYLELFARDPDNQEQDWPPAGWTVWGNQGSEVRSQKPEAAGVGGGRPAKAK